jgi:hypothetical protein
VTAALGLWLVVLILGGLGLQPLAGLPILGDLGAREAAPPALPKRVRAAVAKHSTVAPATGAVQTPVPSAPVPTLRPAVTGPSHAKTRPPAHTTPVTPPGRTKTIPGRGPSAPRPAPSHPTTGPSTTAPGQTRTPPGQTKTETGSPTSTPGATGNAHANGTVTTP